MPRSSHAASCSGSTARPTSGTNAMRPSPAVARIEATVAITTHDQHHAEDAATSRRWPQTNVSARRTPRAHADVLDRHDHLRHQVEEVDERDPDDQHARRQRGRRPSSRAARRVAGQRVAAEDERRDRRPRSARRRAAGRARCGRSGATAAAQSVEERLDARRRARGAAPRAQRRPLDRARRALGFGEQRDGAPLDDERAACDPPTKHEQRDADEGGERRRARASARR